MTEGVKRRKSSGTHVNFAFDVTEYIPETQEAEDVGMCEEMDKVQYVDTDPVAADLEGDQDKFSCWHKCTRGVRSIWATRLTEDLSGNREKYIHTTLRELILYVIFLATLMIIAFVPINEETYLLTSMMENTFMTEAVEGEDTTLESVSNLDDLWKVLNGPIMDAWYDNRWYNGQPMWNDEGRLSVQYNNPLIGIPRLRQLRMSNRSCVVPNDFQADIKECFAPYDVIGEDKSPFGLKQGTAWTYTPYDKLEMEPYLGKVSYYSGGGFYQDLAYNRTIADSQMQELFDNLWLDRGTRALFIHFTTYNPNLNVFCVVQLLIETPASGGFVVSSEFRSIKLLRYVSTLDYFVLACEGIFLLFTLYYIVEEIMEIAKHKCAYFTSIWNILDIILILLSLTCAAFNIYRTVLINETLGNLLKNADQFANFQYLSYWQVTFNYGIAVMVFLAWIKLFKYISFNKTMTQLSSTLGKCGKDLAGFSVMFFIVFFAFAELGYLAFGTQVGDFSAFSTSVYTLFRIILGDFDFGALEKANSIFGPIYFIVYVFFVFFVLINMFIAIINETYEDVKSDLKTQENEFEMKDFFKKRMKGMMDRMRKKKSRIEKLQRAMEMAHKSGVDRMNFQQLHEHLRSCGFSDGEIQNVLGRFDSDHDQTLSSTEQLKMQAELEEEKMALVNEMAKEEQFVLETAAADAGDEAPQAQVSLAEFNTTLRRVGRIESGMNTIMQHLRTVLDGLNSVEKSKLIRREAMTRLLRVVTTEPTEAETSMQDIVKETLNVYDETPKDDQADP